MAERLQLRVTAMRWEAEDVLSVELCPLAGELPPFESGAHLDLHLPNGLDRSYSLCNLDSSENRYVIGVGRDAQSRGGSLYIHDRLRPGDVLSVSPPRSTFKLNEAASETLFIAGGIGITPFLSMTRRLNQLGKRPKLHYAVRDSRRAAFLSDLSRLDVDLRLHVDAEHSGRPLDMAAALTDASLDAHLYCCGPGPMLAAFEQFAAQWPEDHRHVEYFKPIATERPAGQAFTVEIKSTGRRFEIPADCSILEVLRKNGVSCESSCEDGVCGTCETDVVSGIPDHRDHVLSAAEKASNATMMICVSRSRDSLLVLDL